jgi:uncharacterized protein (DUF983 family)
VRGLGYPSRTCNCAEDQLSDCCLLQLAALGFPLSIRVTQWLAQLGIGLMPMATLLPLWDWLFVVGPAATILFAAVLVQRLEGAMVRRQCVCTPSLG